MAQTEVMKDAIRKLYNWELVGIVKNGVEVVPGARYVVPGDRYVVPGDRYVARSFLIAT